MTLKSNYDNMPGELKHMIAGSDEEIYQLESTAHPIHVELPTTGTLSPRESATLRQQVESNALIEEMLGISSPSVFKVDAPLLGANGKPLNPNSLEDNYRKLMDAVAAGLAKGDPELLKLARAATATTTNDDPVHIIPASSLLKQMAERADEFLAEDSPIAAAFIKAYAVGDRAGMRQAVQPLAREMVAAEA